MKRNEILKVDIHIRFSRKKLAKNGLFFLLTLSCALQSTVILLGYVTPVM